MAEKYELLYGYFHCTGKTEYIYGYADTEEEAARWVEENLNNNCKNLKIPAGDPVRSCPADFCFVKASRPYAAYSKKKRGR